jgi:hypothetical protein
MATEMLSYSQLGERLNCSPEVARALVRRLRLPRQKANDGKVLVSVDLSEINHKPIPITTRSPPRSRRASRRCKRVWLSWTPQSPVTGPTSSVSGSAWSGSWSTCCGQPLTPRPGRAEGPAVATVVAATGGLSPQR